MEFGEDALLNGRRQSAEEAEKEDRRFAESPEYNRVRIRKVLDRESFQNALYRIPTDHFPVRATSESGEPVRSIDGLRAIYGGLKENSPPLVYSMLGGPDASNAEQGTRFGVFFALAVVSVLTGGTVMAAAQKAMGMTTGTLVASGGMAFVEHNIAYFHGALWGDDVSFDSWWKSSLVATGLGVAAGGIGLGLVRANAKPVGAAGAKPAVEPPSGGGVRPAGSKASSGAIEVAEGGASPGAAGKGGSGARAPMDASPSEASGTVSVQGGVRPGVGVQVRVQGDTASEVAGGLGRTVDDLPVSIDTNAYLDMFANQSAADAARVAARSGYTRAVVGGREVYLPPRVVEELTRGGQRTVEQVFADLRAVAGRVGQGPEGHPDTIAKLAQTLKRGDPRVGASAFELGGDVATGDKGLARALVRNLGYPRDRIISLRPDVWQPGSLAVLAALLGWGATSSDAQQKPVLTPEHQ